MNKKINKANLESWLHSIKKSEPRLRYLFYDFNYIAIRIIKDSYSEPNSVQFLGGDFYFWTFEETASFYTPTLGVIQNIGYEDLVTARNKDEKFIVLIPKLGGMNFNLLPSDSSKGTAFKVHNSEFEFAKYILNEVLIPYNFNRIHLTQMQDLLFENFANDTYHFFTKEINSHDDVLKFYGILSNNPTFFNDEKNINKCIYRVKFIDKLKDFLIANSISELELKLKENNVDNYKEVIEAFWAEPYTLSRDLGKDIDLVFFRNTEKYALIINVQEWIDALNDDSIMSPKSEITYDGKDRNDQYSVLFSKNEFILNIKGGDYFIPSLISSKSDFIENGIDLSLTDEIEAEWLLNNEELPEKNVVYNYKPSESGLLANVKAVKFDEKRFINLALYNFSDSNKFLDDFAFSLKIINNKGDKDRIPIILNKKKELTGDLKDTIDDINQLVKITCPEYFQSDFDNIEENDFTYFKFKNKKSDLELNARLEIDFRFISDNLDLTLIAFQELNSSEIRYNYKNSKNFKESKIGNGIFKDFSFLIDEIADGILFFKIKSRWVVIEIATEIGDEKDLFVGNTFLKLKALNDTEFSKRKIRIIQKELNDVHQFYFSEKFDCPLLYLPTIFSIQNSIKLLNPESDNCPVIGSDNLIIPQREFRPSRIEFLEFFKINDVFKQYIKNQESIKLFLQKEMIGNSIDDIDFSKIDVSLIEIIENQLVLYQKIIEDNYKLGVYLDLFFIVEEDDFLMRDEPLAVFFSPFHPFLLSQLISKSILMNNTVFDHKILKPNSLCQTIQLNILKEWVLLSNKTEESLVFHSVDTDSLLFTGFINSHFTHKENNLSKILKQFEVESNDTDGFLSYSQIQSALRKSFDYLSKKPEFNICVKGELPDQTTNKAILDWVQKINKKINEEFLNHQLVINIFDERSPSINPYPASNEISYFKNDLNLDINWYKTSDMDSKIYDLTIVTSKNSIKSILVQDDKELHTNNFNYKNLLDFKLIKKNNFTLLTDLLSQNSVNDNQFDKVWNSLNELFFNLLKNQKKQIEHNLQGAKFENTQLLALSSSISSSRILQNVNQGKSLWEFSISDFSFQDSGRGDYYLLAEEQNDYVLRFKNFIQEINNEVTDFVFNQFINYSKEIGLFQLKNLLSNSNFLKEFIACVTSRKLIDCAIKKKNSIIIPYDLFEPRLRKIQKEIQPNIDKSGTQFPDFILIEFTDNELCQSIIDFRLIEIKYRKDSISEKDMNQILLDQTSRIKEIFFELNNYREKYDDTSMWHHTLSIILADMFSYYNDNNDTLNSNSSVIFNKIINSDYLFRLNDSLLIAIDGSLNFENNKIEKGEYFKVPTRYIHQVFDCDSDINIGFRQLFENMERSTNIINIDEEIEKHTKKDDDFQDLELKNKMEKNDGQNILISNDLNIIELQNNTKTSKYSNVILGKDQRNNVACYYPKGRPGGSPLPNYNIMVTGSSGKGKTQFVKSFIYQQSLTGTSFTIIDFRNDYSDKYFCDLCKCTKIEVKFDGIPYNPLIPRLGIRDDGSKYYDVSEHINAICAVLGNTFGLGIQQESDLKKAVRKVFKDQNINPSGILEYNVSLTFPSFNEVGSYLEEGDKELEKLYNRLDPLFDLNLFRDKYKNVEFTEIINSSNIFKVSDIQDDKIKNAIAKIIIVSAHGYYLGIPHSYSLKKLFVFDEAHRILDSDFVEKFIRECRAFGVGLLLSSQQPDDFPENILGQLSTKIIHGNEADSRLTRKIKSLISYRGDDSKITDLKTFEAILNSQDYNNWIIETLAWPQLMILNIIRLNNEGINFIDLISASEKIGINKDWEEYILLLINKEYIELKNEKYLIKI